MVVSKNSYQSVAEVADTGAAVAAPVARAYFGAIGRADIAAGMKREMYRLPRL